MTTEKITKRDMYEAIIGAMKTGEIKYAPDDVIAFCQNEIELLDKKAAKAKERAAAKSAENDEIMDKVRDVLSPNDFMPIADVVKAIGDPDLTAAKIQYRLRKLAEANEAEKTEVTIAGADGTKPRKVVAYRRLTTAPVEE